MLLMITMMRMMVVVMVTIMTMMLHTEVIVEILVVHKSPVVPFPLRQFADSCPAITMGLSFFFSIYIYGVKIFNVQCASSGCW